MNIAYTMAPGQGDTDLLLAALAERLKSQGLRAAGIVQFNSERAKSGPCDMDVKVLPDGPVIRISQDLGAEAKGCRLDTAGLEAAVGHVEAGMSAGADVLIVNKFGKHEAEGRGFRTVIGAALANDIPTVIGVNQLNFDAFLDFTGGLAEHLPADATVLESWILAHVPSLARAG